jgi:hypothetical protein
MKQFVVLAGGLGNQLFQIASALSSTDRNIYVVTCIGEPKKHLGKIEISNLDFGSRIIFLECSQSHFVSRKAFLVLLSLATNRRHLFANTLSRILILSTTSVIISTHLRSLTFPRVSVGAGYDPNFVSRRGNLYVGYFQTYRIDELAKDLLTKALNKYALSHLNPSHPRLDLVIHSRLGDYKNEPLFGTIGLDYFSKSLKILSERIDLRKIGLFSDEPILAIQQMPAEYIDFIKVKESSDDSPLLVLLKMRYARNYILSNSTFGWWAAFTSAPEKVIVPSPWFSDGETPNEFLPEPWVKIVRS